MFKISQKPIDINRKKILNNFFVNQKKKSISVN